MGGLPPLLFMSVLDEPEPPHSLVLGGSTWQKKPHRFCMLYHTSKYTRRASEAYRRTHKERATCVAALPFSSSLRQQSRPDASVAAIPEGNHTTITYRRQQPFGAE